MLDGLVSSHPSSFMMKSVDQTSVGEMVFDEMKWNPIATICKKKKYERQNCESKNRENPIISSGQFFSSKMMEDNDKAFFSLFVNRPNEVDVGCGWAHLQKNLKFPL